MENTWNDIAIDRGPGDWRFECKFTEGAQRTILKALEETFVVPLLQADRESLEDGRVKVVFFLDPADGENLQAGFVKAGILSPTQIKGQDSALN